uniref:Uncharacterized protein n=1 Tax=Globisporangium ultimum (strain ATCC 200006 / CBS 805.95 / DAOM BR144) TaxID=431595 RepID=K3WHG0_GLOUD
PSASLNDLEIVRKIVEREGCLEALEQLVTAPQRKTTVKASTATGAVGLELDQLYLYTFPRRQSTATTSPLVLQSVLDQLRSVSVQIVEAIENWRAANGMQVFQWRNANYLLKMAGDVDFLAQTVGIAGINALQQLRLERNPFLAPLHLDHAALREKVPDAAILLGAWVGNVDMKRIFYVSKVLLRELETERMQQQQEANDEDEGEGGDGNFKTDHLEPSVLTASRHSMLRHPATTMRVRWRHQSVQLRPQFGNESTGYDGDGSQVDAALSVEDTMRQDVALCKELILHAEHELGAIREEIAILQEKLNMDITPLSETKRRTLQIKVGALTNTLKFKSGDLYQRKNELRRKEAVLHQRLNDTQHGGRTTRSRRSQPSSSSSSPPQRHRIRT